MGAYALTDPSGSSDRLFFSPFVFWVGTYLVAFATNSNRFLTADGEAWLVAKEDRGDDVGTLASALLCTAFYFVHAAPTMVQPLVATKHSCPLCAHHPAPISDLPSPFSLARPARAHISGFSLCRSLSLSLSLALSRSISLTHTCNRQESLCWRPRVSVFWSSRPPSPRRQWPAPLPAPAGFVPSSPATLQYGSHAHV